MKHRPEIAFVAFALLLWGALHPDFGATWDETPHAVYGEQVRAFLASGQSYPDFARSLLPKQEYYSPVLDLMGATVAHALQMPRFDARHAVMGLIWVSMFVPGCALGRRLGGEPGAWFAGLALLGSPVLIGHGFNNLKDMPLAVSALWLLAASAWAAASPHLSGRHLIGLGTALGFVLMMRPGAWFLGVLFGLVPLGRFLANGTLPERLRRAFLTLPWLLGATAIAWALMCALWPYAWQDPLLNPIRSMMFARSFDEVYPVRFAGQTYDSNALPWTYLPTYLILTTPLPILVLAVGGLCAPSSWKPAARAATLGAAFLIFFPLAFFVAARPNIYDGLRHFLFMLPALAVLAGAGAAWLLLRLPSRGPLWLRAALISLLLLTAVPAAVRLHPYQSTYYNILAGDRATLHERYETDYWVSSYREAARWINSQQARSPRPLRVVVAGTAFSFPAFTDFLDPRVQTGGALGRFAETTLPEPFDFYVATVRYDQWKNFPDSPLVHRIEREGVLMSVIRSREPLPSTP